MIKNYGAKVRKGGKGVKEEEGKGKKNIVPGYVFNKSHQWHAITNQKKILLTTCFISTNYHQQISMDCTITSLHFITMGYQQCIHAQL